MSSLRSVDAGQKKKRWLGFSMQFVCWLLIAFGAVAIGIARWVRRTFGQVPFESVLINLQGAGGEGGGGSKIVWDAILQGLVIPLLATAIVFALWFSIRRAIRTRFGTAAHVPSAAFLAVIVGVVVVTGWRALDQTLTIGEFFNPAQSDHSLSEFYVSPVLDQPEDSTQTNLVLIYLESMEDTFSDTSLFEVDMLESLDRETVGWQTVETFRTYAGGGWTISSIVATQCGVPLKLASGFGDTSPNKWEGTEYLPAVVCLGDVLEDQGFTNVYMGGADSNFSSKNVFLTSHGYDRVLDLEHWMSQGETELREDWGLSDRALFENAKEELLDLREAGEPYNLTILTLDTHESAYLFDYCDQVTEDPMESVTKCSADVVADFVQFMKDEGVLEDTSVVIMGDHIKIIAETNAFYEQLNDLEDRTVYNRIWTHIPDKIVRSNIDQMSMYPTILEAMGFNLVDGRAGIGVSAYTEEAPGTIFDLPDEEYEMLIRAKDPDFYDPLWSGATS